MQNCPISVLSSLHTIGAMIPEGALAEIQFVEFKKIVECHLSMKTNINAMS